MESSSKKVVEWISKEIEVQSKPSILENKQVKFYNKCIFGPMILNTNDFVLVSNADSSEPDSEEGCDVARIVYLFEIFEPLLATKRDPYRAIVQWYCRPRQIEEKYYDDDLIAIDFDKEIIEDHRTFSNNISIEAIFKKCQVVLGDRKNSVEELIRRKPKTVGPMFACRFKFIKTGARSFKLVALGYINPDESTEVKTPKRRKSVYKKINEVDFVDVGNNTNMLMTEGVTFDKENMVSPIKIINNSVVKIGKSTGKKENDLNEINANYLKSPAMEKLYAAKRNLNISLDNDGNSSIDSDCLNYSIITESAKTPTEATDPLKIKIRVSERQTPRRMSTRRQSRLADEIEAATPKSSARTGILESMESSSSLMTTPVKAKNVENAVGMITPLTGTTAARRKSILKTPGSKSAVGTPKRSIQLTNIVEEKVYDTNEAILSTPSRKRTATNPRKVEPTDDEEYTPSKKKSTTSSIKKKTPSKTIKSEDTVTPSRKRRSVKVGKGFFFIYLITYFHKM